MADEPAPGGEAIEPGAAIVNLSFAGTGVFVSAVVATAIVPDTLGVAFIVVSCVLFALGVGTFLWAYAVGVSRSREELVTLPGLFFLVGSAPRTTAFRLRLALVVQIVAATAGASVRPFSDLAFGVLAPLFGLGLMSLWGARYGAFEPRHAAMADRDES